MKIAFINKYQNKIARGSETFVAELSKRLAANNEVDVLTGIKGLLKKKYDVIIPTNGRFQVIAVRKIAWLTGAKVVISGQSGQGWDDRINLYSFPDTFAALSTKAMNWASKVNPFVKLVYIPNGVDLNKFKPVGEKFSSKLKHPIVLAVGAFTEEKRMDLAIKAVAKTNASLLIVGGGGDMKQELKNEGEKLLGSRFELITIPHGDMPDVYRASDVFTLPSWSHESFGNVLVEAMASDLPVVATEDPIRREIVGDAGILVDPTDTSEYANALKKALETSWGDKPRKQAEKFSWDEIAKKYEELFENLNS